MSDWFVYFNVSMSTMPRSDSFAVSTVAIFSMSAFFCSSWFVISVTLRCASIAFCESAMPSEITIWFFHSGIVFMMEVWIFSIIRLSLFWIMRICGAVWREMTRVSSRSCSFFSKRMHLFSKSFAACASSGRPDFSAFSRRAFSSVFRASASFCLPARIYIVSSLK